MTSTSACHHIVALQHPDHEAASVQQFLAETHGAHVSSRGGRIRVSLHGYNDSSDIEVLATGLAAFG